MPRKRSQVTFHYDVLAKMNQPSGEIGAATKRAAERTAARARQNLIQADRIRTGRLLGSIRVSHRSSDVRKVTFVAFSSLYYAKWQHDGIGPVFARPGKVLAFKPKGSGVTIFRPRTRGFDGVPFLKDAVLALTARDFL